MSILNQENIGKISNAVLDYVLNSNWKKDNSVEGGFGAIASKNIKPQEKIGIAYYAIGSVRDKKADKDKDYIRTELGCLIGFSKTPNAIIEKNDSEYEVVASKNIRSGEEITIDSKSFPWK